MTLYTQGMQDRILDFVTDTAKHCGASAQEIDMIGSGFKTIWIPLFEKNNWSLEEIEKAKWKLLSTPRKRKGIQYSDFHEIHSEVHQYKSKSQISFAEYEVAVANGQKPGAEILVWFPHSGKDTEPYFFEIVNWFDLFNLQAKLTWAYGIDPEDKKPRNLTTAWAAEFYRLNYKGGWDFDWKREATFWLQKELYSRRLIIEKLDFFCSQYHRNLPAWTAQGEKMDWNLMYEIAGLTKKMKVTKEVNPTLT